jgi:hypothetical protein
MRCGHRRLRAGAVCLSLCVVAVLGQGCGGGAGNTSDTGGNGGNNGGGNPTLTPRATVTPRPTSTRPPASPPRTQPAQGGTPTPTPTPTAAEPTEVPTATPAQVTVFSGASIASAAKKLPGGGIVVVAPGTYRPVVLQPGDLQGPVTLFADVTGEFSNSAPAAVTIVATGSDETAFAAFSQSALAIDGFTLRGGTRAGFLCSDCSGIVIQDCTVTGGGGDALRFELSDDAQVFNNLVMGNKGAGIRGLGATNLQVINNTIYRNRDGGIVLSRGGTENPSSDAFLRNNILNGNTPTGIVVDLGPPSSLDGFDGNFDLNIDGYSGTPAGVNDIAVDPLFIFPTGSDFHLAPGSQAIDGGTDGIDPDLVSQLQELTTQSDGSLDTAQPDIGYHYIAPIPTPTRAPRNTRTSTPTARNTNTPTRTPTP